MQQQQQQLVCSSFYRPCCVKCIIVQSSPLPNKLNDLTIVKHVDILEIEVVSTLSSFRFPELSQPI
jgi:hypothetical protein